MILQASTSASTVAPGPESSRERALGRKSPDPSLQSSSARDLDALREQLRNCMKKCCVEEGQKEEYVLCLGLFLKQLLHSRTFFLLSVTS